MNNKDFSKDLEPILFCVQHQPEMELLDQLKVLEIMLEASKKLRPLYAKYNLKEENGATFLFRWNPEEDV